MSASVGSARSLYAHTFSSSSACSLSAHTLLSSSACATSTVFRAFIGPSFSGRFPNADQFLQFDARGIGIGLTQSSPHSTGQWVFCNASHLSDSSDNSEQVPLDFLTGSFTGGRVFGLAAEGFAALSSFFAL